MSWKETGALSAHLAARLPASTVAATTVARPSQSDFAVSRFITGVMGDFVRNDETTYDVAHLDSMIQAILEGIRGSCQRATRA
jgi:hypothetical protein